MTTSELMEQGIRAYTRGQLGEAERCWRDVLVLEPANARAHSYLELLVGKLAGAAAGAGDSAVPLPAPARSARSAAPQRPRAGDDTEAVPLPAPEAPPPAACPPPARSSAPVPLPPPRPEGGWAASPATFAAPNLPDPAAEQDFADCWEGERGEITAPITTTSEHPLVPPQEAVEEPLRESLVPAASLPATAPEEAASGPLPLRDPRPSARLDGTSQPPSPGGVGSEPSWSPDPFSPAAMAALSDSSPSLPERTTLSDFAPSPWDQGPARAPAVVLDDGIGLDLGMVAEQSDLHSLVPEAIGQARPRTARSEVEIWMDGARELFALGDFSGSLEMIEKILKIDPSHAEAREYLKQNEATLIAMYESKLGPAGAVPHLAIKPEEVMWLNLDHRAGFLLAQIDGMVSYEDLFALSGLPRLDTARILATLLQEGVIRS